MSDSIRFTVFGTPKAQPRARSKGPGKRGVYNPSTAKGWKDFVYLRALAHRPAEPLAGPLRIDADFYFPRPKNRCRKCDPDGRIWHTAKPDRDNLDKAVLDALTAMGFLRDDRIVCDGRIRKFYHEKDGTPRCDITITPINEEAP